MKRLLGIAWPAATWSPGVSGCEGATTSGVVGVVVVACVTGGSVCVEIVGIAACLPLKTPAAARIPKKTASTAAARIATCVRVSTTPRTTMSSPLLRARRCSSPGSTQTSSASS